MSERQTVGILADQLPGGGRLPVSPLIRAPPPTIYLLLKVHVVVACQEIPSLKRTEETTKKNYLARESKCHYPFIYCSLGTFTK